MSSHEQTLPHARPVTFPSDSSVAAAAAADVDDDGVSQLTALRVAVNNNNNNKSSTSSLVLAERSLNVSKPSHDAPRSPKLLLESRQGSTDSDWLTHRSSGFGSSPEGTTPKVSRQMKHPFATAAVPLPSPLRPDATDSAAEPPTPAPTTVAAAAAIAAADAAAAAKVADARADAELAAAAMAVRLEGRDGS